MSSPSSGPPASRRSSGTRHMRLRRRRLWVAGCRLLMSLQPATNNQQPKKLMIDTHCHLTDHRLGGQLEDVLARATAAGVSRVITISTSVADAIDCIELCKGRDNIRCSVG